MMEAEVESDRVFKHIKLFIFLTVIVPIIAVVAFLEWRFRTITVELHGTQPGARDESRMEIETLPWHPIQGQLLYVPAYSHVFHQSGEPHLLTVTLSIRNTDRNHEIVLTKVQYFDSSGKLVRTMVERPLKLSPLASTEYVIDRNDKSGGSGASFIVEWNSGNPVTEPVVEAVMIDTSGGQGISFVTSSRVLQDTTSATLPN